MDQVAANQHDEGQQEKTDQHEHDQQLVTGQLHCRQCLAQFAARQVHALDRHIVDLHAKPP
jgi:cytochrome c-type biogenesis protein CcmH/NrfF